MNSPNIRTHEVIVRFQFTAAQARAALLIVLFAAIPLELGSETITLSTTYPSPVGIYNRIITTGNPSTAPNNNTLLARDGGMVGIGTPSPQSMLHVKYPLAETVGAANGILIENSSKSPISSPGSPRIGFVDTLLGSITSAPAWYIDNWADRFRIFRSPNLSTPGVEFVTIMNNGNIGIGTIAPGQKLSVVGTIESTAGGFKFPDGTVQTTAGGSYGGFYLWNGDASCRQANPVTGDCSCPAGFTSVPIYYVNNGFGANQAICLR